MAQPCSSQEALLRIANPLQDGFLSVYRRFRPFIWRGRVERPRRINRLGDSPFLTPFKYGENGENGTSIHPVLTHHNTRRGARAALVGGELLPYPAGDVLVGLGMRAVRLGDNDRMATVGRGADVEMQRDLAEERHPEL